MESIILRQGSKFLLPLMLLVSVFLLGRGHYDPGGGFAGGLVAATGLLLYGLAFGMDEARRALRISPASLIALGLLVAVTSALVPVANGKAILTGVWYSVGDIEFGTPFLFDIGVYLVVIGVVLTLVLNLAEE
ncbi:MAG: Na+/H+ antiporter subunit B [Fimbriimonadaceae bacterium]|nr:Na+/H+ antiporter subunit B [Fimbriimonadaceae bacterium]